MSEQEVWRKHHDNEPYDGQSAYLFAGNYVWLPTSVGDEILREHQSATALQWAIDHTAENGSVTSGLIKAAEARIAELEARLAADLGTDWKQLYEREREHFLMEDTARAVESKRADASEAEAAALRELVQEAVDAGVGALTQEWFEEAEAILKEYPCEKV